MRKAAAIALVLALLITAIAGKQLVNSGKGNPYWPGLIVEQEVPPPKGAQPPVISIFFPVNKTAFASNNVSVSFNVSKAESSNVYLRVIDVYYRASWDRLEPHNIQVDPMAFYGVPKYGFELPRSFSVNLTGVPEGPHWLEIYAVAMGISETHDAYQGPQNTHVTIHYVYKIAGSSAVDFSIDHIPPDVSVLSVENKTYETLHTPLDFTVNETATQISYSLDGQDNMTVSGNTTLTNLSNGEHNVTVYAIDTAGHTGVSETVYFSVKEPFPAILVIAASVTVIVVVAAGLLVYFKKQRSLGEHS